MKTIQHVVENGLCTGCGTCVTICNKNAVNMKIDHKHGVYIPQLIKDKCNECGMCYDTCIEKEIIINNNKSQSNVKQLIGDYTDCFIGYSTDYNIRYNSTSGGIITSILIFALEKGIINGAIVTRMNKNNPLEPETFIARTREEIIEASKSKYCPVPMNIILKEVISSKNNDKLAFVGLPCHIQGLHKIQESNSILQDKIKLRLGLFCAHTDSFLATEFILNCHNINTKNVKKIEYRGRGWSGSMLIELHTGNIITIPFKDYIKLFHSYNFFTPKRCLLCSDATAELADISFGDAWGIPSIKDNIGTSILINRTKIGNNILQNMKINDKIKLINTSVKNIIISQRGLLYTKKIGFRMRMNILKMFGKKVPNNDMYQFKDNGFISFDTMLPYINTYFSENKNLTKLLKYIPEKIIRCYGIIPHGMAYIWSLYWLRKNKICD